MPPGLAGRAEGHLGGRMESEGSGPGHPPLPSGQGCLDFWSKSGRQVTQAIGMRADHASLCQAHSQPCCL